MARCLTLFHQLLVCMTLPGFVGSPEMVLKPGGPWTHSAV